jgi:hypothetical protein
MDKTWVSSLKLVDVKIAQSAETRVVSTYHTVVLSYFNIFIMGEVPPIDAFSCSVFEMEVFGGYQFPEIISTVLSYSLVNICK